MKGYETKELCKKCGGRCCKGMPAPALPEDFDDADPETLKKAIDTGKWAIDYLDLIGLAEPTEETESKAYYIRPKVKGNAELVDTAKTGICIFWSSKGCKLPFDERPAGCRYLEPKEDGHCLQHGPNVKHAAMAWIPHGWLIEKIINENSRVLD